MKVGDRVRRTTRSVGLPRSWGTVEMVTGGELGYPFVHVRWDRYDGALVALPEWTVEPAGAVDQLAALLRDAP